MTENIVCVYSSVVAAIRLSVQMSQRPAYRIRKKATVTPKTRTNDSKHVLSSETKLAMCHVYTCHHRNHWVSKDILEVSSGIPAVNAPLKLAPMP